MARGKLGFFGNFFAPVVQTVAQAFTPLVVPVFEPLIKLFSPIFLPVIEALAPIFEPIAGPILNIFSPAIDSIGEAAITGTIKGLENGFANGYVPKDADLSRFEAVVSESEQVQTQQVNAGSLSSKGQAEIRDAMIAARHGYSDYSELLAKGIVNNSGHVINSDAYFANAARQISLPVSGENWSKGEIEWSKARFEVVRVMEKSGTDTYGGFEANVVLTKNIATGEYFISVGGTDSIRDATTDLSLIFSEDTGASKQAVKQMIDQMMRDDIPANAVVNLAGHSLGASEILLQYRDNPDAFNHVYPIQAVGIGGFDGTYYDRFVWDGKGDPNITEIHGDDPGTDFNDLVTYWGHVGAGTVVNTAPVKNVGESDAFGQDIELLDAHLLGNLWATLPGGDNPAIPASVAPTTAPQTASPTPVAPSTAYAENSGNDKIKGTAKSDEIFAGRGNDTVNAGKGNDKVYGGAGNDVLKGQGGNDVLKGQGGNDVLEGGAGNDKLLGSRGNDILHGGEGNDMLKGGQGSDVFVFETGDGRDTILDFRTGGTGKKNKKSGDKIELDVDGVSNWGDLASFGDQVGKNVVFDFGDDDILTLRNASFDNLDADDFDFA